MPSPEGSASAPSPRSPLTDAARAATLGLLLVACVSEAPPSPPLGSGTARPTSPATIELPQPGRPFDGDAVLEAMRGSRRPGGVPDQIEVPDVADAVASQLWTFDGEPWPDLVASGSCGAQACTLEMSGTPAGAPGEDLYVFRVAPDGAVGLVSTSLRGLPSSLVPRLDGALRDAWPADRLHGLVLVSARWLPPPDDGEFVLAYRSGGEEGSPGVDLRFDAVRGAVLESTPAP